MLTSLQRGLLSIAIYVIVLRIVTLFLSFPVARLGKHIGVSGMVVIGNLALIGQYFASVMFKTHPIFLILVGVFSGLEIAFYWPAFRTLFSVQADFKHMGRDVGAFQFILTLLNGLLPALSGLLILNTSFSIAFGVGIVFVIASTLPILMMRSPAVSGDQSFKGYVHWLKSAGNRTITLATWGRYIEESFIDIWFIYIFLNLKSIDRMGFIVSMAFFISLIVDYLVGWYIDHKRSMRPFIFGSLLMVFAWILRFTAKGVGSILSVEVLDKIAVALTLPTFDAIVFAMGKHASDVYTFHTYREYSYSIFSIIVWIIAMIVILFIPVPWPFFFGASIVGICVSLVLARVRL